MLPLLASVALTTAALQGLCCTVLSLYSMSIKLSLNYLTADTRPGDFGGGFRTITGELWWLLTIFFFLSPIGVIRLGSGVVASDSEDCFGNSDT